MWFFIITLMVIGAFFLGAIFAYVPAKEIQTDRDFFKEQLKVITDALRNTSRPEKTEGETFGCRHIPGAHMPNTEQYFSDLMVPTITSVSDGENE